MEALELSRKFIYKNKAEEIELDDIPGLTPDEIMKIYAGIYPELTNGSWNYKGIENDKYEVYELQPIIGVKG